MPFFSFKEIEDATHGEWIRKNESAHGVADVFTDTRKESPDSLFIALPGENFDAHDYLADAVKKGAVLLCVEKSKVGKVPHGVAAIAVDSTVSAYQALANMHRRRFKKLKVVALTGSSGKTSTKETLRAIFNRLFGAEHVLATEGNTNNQVGVPQNMMRLTEQHRICILEMGTNHHGEIEPLSKCAEPDAAMIVSIGNCHLEFLGSLEGVASEKSKIFAHMNREHGIAVIPAECPGNDILKKAASPFGTYTFGFGGKAFITVDYKGGNIAGSSFTLKNTNTGESAVVNWSLSGRHQAGNAAGAAAVAAAMGFPLKDICEGISGTTLPGMRMRLSEHMGAKWINDAYNANPDSMKASIEWLSEFADPAKLLLVLGDMREIGENSVAAHRTLLEFAMWKFPDTRIAAVGPDMSSAYGQIKEAGARNIRIFSDSQTAVSGVREMAKAGDIVFLKASRGTKLELVEPKT